MSRFLKSFILFFLTAIIMGTQCDKEVDYISPKQSFAEKANLSPVRKLYSINDTIWVEFNTSSKTLFDTISNQRLTSDAVKFKFGAALLAKYDTPDNPSGGYCDFILPGNVSASFVSTRSGTTTSFDVGCNNAPNYNIKIGVVLKHKGYYNLDMATRSRIEPCNGQSNPYPSSSILFTFNVTDNNKDVFLTIPASARNEYPSGLTERQLDLKVIYALKVQ